MQPVNKYCNSRARLINITAELAEVAEEENLEAEVVVNTNSISSSITPPPVASRNK